MCYVLKLFSFSHKALCRTACLPSSTSFHFLLLPPRRLSTLSLFLLESARLFQLLPLGTAFPDRVEVAVFLLSQGFVTTINNNNNNNGQ